MSLIDVLVVVLVIAYAIIGYYSGVIRRVVGFLTLFLGFGAATYLSPDGGRFLQQSVTTGLDPANARIYVFVGFLALVIVLVEGLAAAYNPLLQFSVIMLDRVTGLVLGALTGLVLSIMLVWVMNGMGSPANANPSLLQSNIRDSVNTSAVHTPLLKLSGPVITLFSLVLPPEPTKYFSVRAR